MLDVQAAARELLRFTDAPRGAASVHIVARDGSFRLVVSVESEWLDRFVGLPPVFRGYAVDVEKRGAPAKLI